MTAAAAHAAASRAPAPPPPAGPAAPPTGAPTAPSAAAATPPADADADWRLWETADPARYNAQVLGPLQVRREGDRLRVRMAPRGAPHANIAGNLHGGVTLGLIDVSLFAIARVLNGVDAAGAVTLDLATQFLGAGAIDAPLEVTGEVLRETGRLVFVRGLVTQGAATIAAFHATLRKPSRGIAG